MILLSAGTTKSKGKKHGSEPQPEDDRITPTTKSVPLKKLTLLTMPTTKKTEPLTTENKLNNKAEPSSQSTPVSKSVRRTRTMHNENEKLTKAKKHKGKPITRRRPGAVVSRKPDGKPMTKPKSRPITKPKPKPLSKPKPKPKLKPKTKKVSKVKGKVEKDNGVPENLKWLTEDPQEALLSRFVETPKGTKLGESIGIDKSRLILKNKLKFYSIPLNSIKEKGDILVLVRKINWKLAAKLGENWRKRTLDFINVESSRKSKVIKIK